MQNRTIVFIVGVVLFTVLYVGALVVSTEVAYQTGYVTGLQKALSHD